MERLLQCLLNELEALGEEHEELYDSEVREKMSKAILDGFIRPKENHTLPDRFGMHSRQADEAVKTALAIYISAASARAAELGILALHARLASFQNLEVKSERGGAFYDDFFGYWPAEVFDSDAFDSVPDVAEAE